MKTLLVTAIVISLLGASVPDESLEPPRAYTVTIDGKSRDFQLEEKFTVEGNFTNPEIKIVASPTRKFPYTGVSFEYPAGFSWGANLSDVNAKSWTMNGDDCIISVYSFGVKVDTHDFALLLAKKFHTDAAKVTPITRKFNNTEVKGYRLPIMLVQTNIVQEILDVSSKTETRMLMIQDTIPEKALRSQEAIKVYDYLNKTLTFTK